MKRVDYALNYAARGWKVLALQPNTKVPIKTALQEHGSKDATDIPDKIRILWGEFPNANIGIATGKQSGLTVLDMDDLEVRHEIEKLPGFVHPTPTYGVRTPRGFHLYYRYDARVEQSAGRVPKVDIRNDGGYVVAAGSSVDGVEYKVIREAEITTWDFPPIFKAGYNSNRNSGGERGWVKKLHETGVSEGQRNAEMFRLAAHYRQLGHGEDELTALVQTFNETKCKPPLAFNEVERIIQSVLRYEPGKQMEFVGRLIEPPLIEAQTDRRKVFYWAEHGIRVELSRIQQRGSRTFARLQVSTSTEGNIYMSSISLYDERSRADVRKALRERHPAADWAGVLHHVAAIVDGHSSHATEMIDLSTHRRKADSPFLVYPLVRAHQPTVLYADGGTGKSTFTLACAFTAATNTTIVPGMNNTAGRAVRTLYLDWEADPDDVAQMLSEIAVGAGVEIPAGMILYRRMSGAFIDNVDELVSDIVERQVEVVIVDSLVASAHDTVTDAEAARYYFDAVRSLNVASIGITHTNKAGSLYGNRFFWNLARQVFRLESVLETEADPVLGLYHEKANRSKLISPMAWNVRYGSDELPSITYEPTDIQGVPELSKTTGLRDRIIGLLRNGSFTVEEISNQLNVDDRHVLNTLVASPATFEKRQGMDNEWQLGDE